MPTITKIETDIIRIARKTPLVTSYGTAPPSGTLIVRAHTDDGIVGVGAAGGETFFSGESVEEMRLVVDRQLAGVVQGQDPFDIVRITDRMDATVPGHPWAKSAVDIALWDVMGRSLGVPVYKLLGGRYHDGLRLMGFVNRGAADAMAEEARSEVKKGFTSVKMKVGIDPREDLHLYRAVRDAVGEHATIQADANGGYSLAVAVKALKAMERYGGLGIAEQPVSRNNIEGMVEVARALEAPVMADESVFTVHDALQVVEKRAAEVVLIKLPKQGGLYNSRRITSILEAAGVSISVAVYNDLIAAAAIHLGMSTKGAVYPGPYTQTVDSILKRPLMVEDRVIKVPEGPGLGVELDDGKLEKYRLE